jgi:hypothetical protein
MSIWNEVPQLVTAIGGLGTAAFGLVDATKAIGGGVNHIGFADIRKRIEQLVPDKSTNGLTLHDVLGTLRENWFTGTDLASQKAIAKSLIRLNFNTDNAQRMATTTGVDATVLRAVAENQAAGTALSPQQSDVNARFDAILTAQLDATYRRADEKYVSATRAWAMVFAILLAVAGASILGEHAPWALADNMFWKAFFVGLLATPLAPIAKDLSTALATAVNTLQLVKK